MHQFSQSLGNLEILHVLGIPFGGIVLAGGLVWSEVLGRQPHTHFSLRNSVSRVDCTFNVLLSNMFSNLVTVKTAFYNNRQTIDLILTLSFGQGGTNARRCEEKEVVLEETRL